MAAFLGPRRACKAEELCLIVGTFATCCAPSTLDQDGLAKRRQQLFDPRIEGFDVPLQLLDQVKMMSDQEPMMRRHVPIERSGEFVLGTFQTCRSELGQLGRVRLARDHRFQHVPAAGADDV
jgi:hypothetical protein